MKHTSDLNPVFFDAIQDRVSARETNAALGMQLRPQPPPGWLAGNLLERVPQHRQITIRLIDAPCASRVIINRLEVFECCG